MIYLIAWNYIFRANGNSEMTVDFFMTREKQDLHWTYLQEVFGRVRPPLLHCSCYSRLVKNSEKTELSILLPDNRGPKTGIFEHIVRELYYFPYCVAYKLDLKFYKKDFEPTCI